MLSHTKYLSLSAAPTHVKPAASQLRSKIWARALRKKLLSALALGALASLPFYAAASVVFATGNPGNTGTDNVVFSPCGFATPDGTTVTGCLNTSHSTKVDFTGDETLHVNGGQARVEADNGSFNFLSIAMGDPYLGFDKIIFNIHTDEDNENGKVDITVKLFSPGSPATQTQSFTVGDGANFFNIVSDGGDVMQWVSIASQSGSWSVDFDDVRQIRIGVATPPGQLPEPGSLALTGAGLGLVALAARRRKQKTGRLGSHV